LDRFWRFRSLFLTLGEIRGTRTHRA
jgi:hypothetical protein